MIVLFTDYGLEGPYIGQVEAVLQVRAAGERVINLLADVPRHNPQAGAYLLAAYSRIFAEESVFFCVVDPGVGSFRDAPVLLKLDNRWYVGPDNGLFDIVCRRAHEIQSWKILWRPNELSASFHGRDLYAPVCAMLARGDDVEKKAFSWSDNHQWPDDLPQVIYIDKFGNCVTGVRAASVDEKAVLLICARKIRAAGTFSDVAPGVSFWYENADGLVEIAVNQGAASTELGLETGSEFSFL